jgi:hypothetical protein
VESIGKLRDLILFSHTEHVSYDLEDAGEDAKIGIVDTVYRTDVDVIETGGRECCLRGYGEDTPDKTGMHGEYVSDIASVFAPEASFYHFLAAEEPDDTNTESVRISQMAFAKAINYSIEHNIDILNISAGRSKPKCTHGHCPYCTEVKRAIDNGISVVAAAGNNPDNCVHCPSNRNEVISVGGVEHECTYNVSRRPGRVINKPPFAYWTKQWERVDGYPDGAAWGAYCTGRDCAKHGGSCRECQEIIEWSENPIAGSDKPDILSPLHYAAKYDEQSPFVWAASSFAAPVVAGALAGMLSTLTSSCPPYTMKEAIKKSSEEKEHLPAGIFRADRTLNRLSE